LTLSTPVLSGFSDNQVSMHFMIARTEKLPTSDSFELIAALAEHLQKQLNGYDSNQSIGALAKLNFKEYIFIQLELIIWLRQRKRLTKTNLTLQMATYLTRIVE